MKAVLLAAGMSTRTKPLTVTRPKPLLKVGNISILERNLSALDGLVDEAILVVGYRAEMVKQAVGDSYRGIRITYAEQKEQRGTGHALMQAAPHLGGSFLLMNGDDLYSAKDIRACIEAGHCVLGSQTREPERFGILIQEDGRLESIVEKPSRESLGDGPWLANTGLYVLPHEVLGQVIGESERGELEVTESVSRLCPSAEIRVLEASSWVPVSYPWDLLEANRVALEGLGGNRTEGPLIKGTVSVGKGTEILPGSFIEGPAAIGKGCTIGPNCRIRGPVSIGDGCRLGQAVEVKNSVIMDGSCVPHLSYVGDSVIGEGCNLGAGTNIANLRHDGRDVSSMVKGVLVDTGLRKLGVIMGDGVRTGIGTIVYPGRKVWPGKSTMPGEIVKEDIC